MHDRSHTLTSEERVDIIVDNDHDELPARPGSTREDLINICLSLQDVSNGPWAQVVSFDTASDFSFSPQLSRRSSRTSSADHCERMHSKELSSLHSEGLEDVESRSKKISVSLRHNPQQDDEATDDSIAVVGHQFPSDRPQRSAAVALVDDLLRSFLSRLSLPAASSEGEARPKDDSIQSKESHMMSH
jgi:hypothetical protein